MLIKILLVDDHELIRKGISNIFESSLDFKIVGQANSGEQALTLVETLNPDVILMDMKMPGMGGYDASCQLLQAYPDIKIIAMTAYDEELLPSRLLQIGVLGYLVKDCSLEEMQQAILKAYKGQHYLSARIAQLLAFRHIAEDLAIDPLAMLSKREIQIMKMLAVGNSIQAISAELNLSIKTVSTYRYRIFEKLHISNNIELTHLAIRYRLLNKNRLNDRAE